MYANNYDHGAYLYQRWNNKRAKNPTALTAAANSKTTTRVQKVLTETHVKVKDEPFVTPTLETLSTINTSSSHQHGNADMLLNNTI